MDAVSASTLPGMYEVLCKPMSERLYMSKANKKHHLAESTMDSTNLISLILYEQFFESMTWRPQLPNLFEEQ